MISIIYSYVFIISVITEQVWRYIFTYKTLTAHSDRKHLAGWVLAHQTQLCFLTLKCSDVLQKLLCELVEKQGSNGSLDANVDFIFKLFTYEVRSHITPLSFNSRPHKHMASVTIFPSKYPFVMIHLPMMKNVEKICTNIQKLLSLQKVTMSFVLSLDVWQVILSSEERERISFGHWKNDK